MSARNSVWLADSDTDFRDFTGRQPPKKLMFSLTGKCNLRCDHCPRSRFEVNAMQTSKVLVDYVAEHLLPGVCLLRMGGTDLGEQLTSKYFDYFLAEVVKHPQVELELISNLTLMDEEKADLIARACNLFSFSLEGVGEYYEANRHYPWAQVETNLRQLVAARARTPGSTLKIGAAVTCYYDNLDQLVPILDLADLGVDEFVYRFFVPNDEQQRFQCLEYHRGEANKVFHQLNATALARGLEVTVPPTFPVAGLRPEAAAPVFIADSHPPIPVSGRTLEPVPWICPFPFETVSVLSDGEVGTCCEGIRLGELALDQEPSILPIWQGDKWRSLRRSVAGGQWTGACIGCDFRRSAEKSLSEGEQGEALDSRITRNPDFEECGRTKKPLYSPKRALKAILALCGLEVRRIR